MNLIAKDEGYKRINYDIFNIDDNQFEKVMISLDKGFIEIEDKDKIKVVVDSLRNDILCNNYKFKDDVIFDGEEQAKGRIEIIYGKGRYVSYLIDKNNKWIEKIVK
ncbi:hypothetical protein [Caloramator sp. mosi_1]|uniref:hypothetical protein n=1 Tax=Caloramator sp. mosi_1 TaxID=3023090 RepID=UPI003FCE5C66